VSAEDFRFDPYAPVKDPLTSEIRTSANALTELVLSDHDAIDGGQLARVLAAVSSTIIMADSLDQISPAIRKVPTPDAPSSQRVLEVSPLEQARTWQMRLYKLIPEKVRDFLEKTFN